jgi:hypothetical protein
VVIGLYRYGGKSAMCLFMAGFMVE